MTTRAIPELAGEETHEHRLVFAVCHELGNWTTGVRLHAHLLDESLPPRDLALASIEIDELCLRSSAMLRQLRPLLSREGPSPGPTSVVSVLGALEHELVEWTGAGAALTFEPLGDLPRVSVDRDVLNALLVTAVLGALDASSAAGGRVTVRASGSAGGGVEIQVVDQTPAEEDLSRWAEQALRGRALACALADRILARMDASLEVEQTAQETRVAFQLPTAFD